MGVNCQTTAWQLTPICNSHSVWDLGGFCCVFLGQNRHSNTQQALSFFLKNNKNDSGGDNKKNILFIDPATPTPPK
eukprot:4840887-Ditylum_brightwellii.AAC.1